MMPPNQPLRARRRKLTGAGLALALGLGTLLAAKPVYHGLKFWRAQRLVLQAEALAATPQWEAAWPKAQAALQLAPQAGSALRLMARLMGRSGRPEALAFWEALLALPEGTSKDREELVAQALALGQLDSAERHLAVALNQPVVPTSTLRLAASFNAKAGRLDVGMRMAREVVRREPGDRATQLLLARQLIGSPEQSFQAEGKRALWDLADRTDPALAREALVTLANSPVLSKPELVNCYHSLKELPTEDPEHRLLLADLQLRLMPQSRATIVAETLSLCQSDPQRLALARWLNRQREFERALETAPPAQAATNSALFLIRLDALAGLGRWPEIRQALGAAAVPLAPALVELYRARAARELKEDRMTQLHWDQAQALAAGKPSLLWYVAQYAETLGEIAEATKAYRRLTKLPGTSRPAYLALVRLVETTASTAELRALLAEVSAKFPGDNEPRNDLAYLDLLLGQNVAQALEVSQKLVEFQPLLLAYRTTLALAYLRSHDPVSAKAVYAGLETDWATVLPGWQAVYTAVLDASGETDAARTLARRIPAQRLKPEERALIEPWLEKNPAGG